MKLRDFLLPFLLLVGYPQVSKAQFKAEANHYSFDSKSEFVDLSLTNPSGIEDLVNTRGDIMLKYRNNAIYGVRNGLLNHSFGGNLDLGVIGSYYNRTEQSTKDENSQTQDSPIGQITTKTIILKDNKVWDYGFALNYKGFFVDYESATNQNKTDGSILIKIGEDQELANFSSESNIKSSVYGAGFKHGFLKLIQNRNQNIDEGGNQEEEKSKAYLINGNYSLRTNERERTRLDIYYDQDKNVSGFFTLNFFNDINFGLSYNQKSDGFTANLSSYNYSTQNREDFERGLENRIRLQPRIYDTKLETNRKYLTDMFFTKPFSYTFSINVNEDRNVTANLNLNLRNVLFHYSEDSQRVGLKLGPAIGSYDFKQKELRGGVFLGNVHD